MRAYMNVLVAVDLAAENQEIMARARAIAGSDTRMAILHVMEPAYFYYGLTPTHEIGMPATTQGYPDETDEQLIGRARGLLDALGERFGVAPERRLLERGHPATQILELAESLETDLIVVGSHGRHGIQLLLGSTANAILHRARCDVLAVRVYDNL